MKITRLFEIIFILLNKKTVTAKELADKFEVSIRTIYRDIDTLCQAGMPIYTTSGKGGGISTLDNFVLNKSVITEEEQNHILLALENISPSIGVSKTIDKLKSMFQKNDVSWIEVDYSRWGCVDIDNNKFDTIKDCILNSIIINFDYISSSGNETKRIVEPIKLVFKTKAWYFQGYCLDKNDYRIFKLNRMNKVCKTQKVFLSKHNNIPSIDTINTIGNINTDDEIILKFSKQVKYRIYDEFSKNDIEENSDGFYNVRLNFPIDEWVANYILSFGEYVEVVSPKELRDKIVSKAKRIIEIYN